MFRSIPIPIPILPKERERERTVFLTLADKKISMSEIIICDISFNCSNTDSWLYTDEELQANEDPFGYFLSPLQDPEAFIHRRR